MDVFYLKCFNHTNNENVSDIDELSIDSGLEELSNEVKNYHKSCLINQFGEMDHSLTIEELVCKLE